MNWRLYLLFLFSCAWSQAASIPCSAQESKPLPAPSADFTHARQLLQTGKIDDAIAELQQLSAAQQVPKGLAHELGTTYYKKGDYVHAIDWFKKAIAEDSQDAESIQLLGISYYLGGHPDDAIPFLEKVQAWYPRVNIDAAYILGQCYIQIKDYSRAQEAFGKMFDLPPNSAATYLLTARMLFRQEFVPVALEYAQKAVALDPKLPLAHFLLGEIHLFESQIPDAISDFEHEEALNPGYAATYYKLADAYSRVQRFDDAQKLLQRSIWLDSTATGPYILMGKVLEKKGEPELAVRALQHAVSMDPNNSMAHHLMGMAYRDLGKSDEAERELKIAGHLEAEQNAKP